MGMKGRNKLRPQTWSKQTNAKKKAERKRKSSVKFKRLHRKKQCNKMAAASGIAATAATAQTQSHRNVVIDANKATKCSLKPIIIDGSNLAFSHGNCKWFSSRGIKIAVDYFLSRGHSEIKALVPRYRRTHNNTLNPEVLDELERRDLLVYTPSRYLNGRLIVPYDDRFILEAAELCDGIIVSNDNYSDIKAERPEWTRLVDNSLLQYTFFNDHFMVADDPMGRHGPKLDKFLQISNMPSNQNTTLKKSVHQRSQQQQEEQHSSIPLIDLTSSPSTHNDVNSLFQSTLPLSSKTHMNQIPPNQFFRFASAFFGLTQTSTHPPQLPKDLFNIQSSIHHHPIPLILLPPQQPQEQQKQLNKRTVVLKENNKQLKPNEPQQNQKRPPLMPNQNFPNKHF